MLRRSLRICSQAVAQRAALSVEERLEQREKRLKERREQQLRSATTELPTFTQKITSHGQPYLLRNKLTTLQINVGLLCNQTCEHCHVEAGPTRTFENMDKRSFDRILHLIQNSDGVQIDTVDLTGGAPEMNPHFRWFVEQIRGLGLKVIDRCNLTVLYEPKQEGLAKFLADHQVEVVASLPCYSAENVDQQRGDNVFERSIRALQEFNSLGYGQPASPLTLHLVYNPLGPFLPPPQNTLELKYKEELKNHFNIEFNNLFTITNMPIKRYADYLFEKGEYTTYMQLLIDNFNYSTVETVMCTNLVSIGWNGKIYDCDFNQQLDMGLMFGQRDTTDIWSINSLKEFEKLKVHVDDHCFGCTAGSGSSCGGSLE